MLDYYPSGTAFQGKLFTSFDDIDKCLQAWAEFVSTKPKLEQEEKVTMSVRHTVLTTQINRYISSLQKQEYEYKEALEIERRLSEIQEKLKSLTKEENSCVFGNYTPHRLNIVGEMNAILDKARNHSTLSIDPLSIDYETIKFQSYAEIHYHINVWTKYYTHNIPDANFYYTASKMKQAIERSLLTMHKNIEGEEIDNAIQESRSVITAWNKLIDIVNPKMPVDYKVTKAKMELDNSNIISRLVHNKSMIGKNNVVTIQIDGERVKFDVSNVKRAHELDDLINGYLGARQTIWYAGIQRLIGYPDGNLDMAQLGNPIHVYIAEPGSLAAIGMQLEINHPNAGIHKDLAMKLALRMANSSQQPLIAKKDEEKNKEPLQTAKDAPVQQIPAPVQQIPAPVQQIPAPVQHTPVQVQHTPVQVQHTPITKKDKEEEENKGPLQTANDSQARHIPAQPQLSKTHLALACLSTTSTCVSVILGAFTSSTVLPTIILGLTLESVAIVLFVEHFGKKAVANQESSAKKSLDV